VYKVWEYLANTDQYPKKVKKTSIAFGALFYLQSAQISYASIVEVKPKTYLRRSAFGQHTELALSPFCV
jgi:hypothetical protein